LKERFDIQPIPGIIKDEKERPFPYGRAQLPGKRLHPLTRGMNARQVSTNCRSPSIQNAINIRFRTETRPKYSSRKSRRDLVVVRKG
jgi:hypothetical protein